MTDEQKTSIKLLIATYEAMGGDWSIALEYEVRKFNGNLPHQERREGRKVRGKSPLTLKERP